MTPISNEGKEATVRAAPFTVEIAPSGYFVKDVHGYTWAACRDHERAKIIRDGLHALAREWRPRP